jgi:hypothetical protein
MRPWFVDGGSMVSSFEGSASTRAMCDEAGATYDIAAQANTETASPAVKSFVSKYSSHATLATMTIDKNENEGKGPSDPGYAALFQKD